MYRSSACDPVDPRDIYLGLTMVNLENQGEKKASTKDHAILLVS